MPAKLIIRLKNTRENPFSWTLLNENGVILENSENLSQAAHTTDYIVVLVPTETILITQVELPKLSKSQLVKALPFALEDQLAEETQKLHFVPGPTPAKGNPLSVAVVSHEKMTLWITLLKEQLKNAYKKIEAFIPDVLALPYEDDQFTVFCDENLALIRTGQLTGFSCEQPNLLAVLQLILRRHPRPKVITIYHKQPEVIAPTLQELGIKIETHAYTGNALVFMAENLNEKHTLNLLTEGYATKQKKLTLLQLVKINLAIIATWLLLLTVAHLVSYLILFPVDTQADEQMKLVYQRIHPNSPIPPDPKVALQKELSALRLTHSDSTFLRLVNLTETAVRNQTMNELNLVSANYRENQLTLEITSRDTAQVDKLQSSLRAENLTTDVKSAVRDTGGNVQTTLTIQETNP